MKTIRKWNPIEIYDIAAMEHWLERMAKNGLFPVKFGRFFVQFEKSSPKPGRRYRLDAKPEYDVNAEAPPEPQGQELYEQAGWNFVGQLWYQRFFVYCSDDPDAAEPYTDPQSRAFSLDALVKQCQNDTLRPCFWIFFITTNVLYRLLRLNIFVLHTLLNFIVLLLWLFNLFYAYRAFRTIRRTRSWLEDGRPLDNYRFPKTRKILLWSRRILSVCLIIAALLGEFLIPKLSQKTMPLEQAGLDFSLLTLAELEGADFVPDPHEVERSHTTAPIYLRTIAGTISYPPNTVTKIEKANYIQFEYRPLSYRLYTICQSGAAHDVPVSMKIDYYILRSPQLTARALEGLVSGSTTAIEVPGSDYFWVSDTGNIIYAACGNRIIKLRYDGTADLSEFYGEIANMVCT